MLSVVAEGFLCVWHMVPSVSTRRAQVARSRWCHVSASAGARPGVTRRPRVGSRPPCVRAKILRSREKHMETQPEKLKPGSV